MPTAPRGDMFFTILLIVLVLLALGSVPAWPYSRRWGYYPSSGLGLLVVVLLLFILFTPSHLGL